jgi:tetratricopeptide (TPR) repeat protein
LQVSLRWLAIGRPRATRSRRRRSLYVELGRKPALRRTCNPIEAEIARLAGDLDHAARLLEGSCEQLLEAGDTFHVATQAAELADILFELGRVDAARAWSARAAEHRQPRDVEATILVLRSRGRLERDPEPAHEAVRLAGETDALNLHATTYVALADVLSRRRRRAEAARALEAARDLYGQKENAAAVAGLQRRPSAAAS